MNRFRNTVAAILSASVCCAISVISGVAQTRKQDSEPTLVNALTREAALEAFQKRHVYGATDDILADVDNLSRFIHKVTMRWMVHGFDGSC